MFARPAIAYPTAARPQAWAAGTPVLLLQLLLGLQPDRRKRRLESVAPPARNDHGVAEVVQPMRERLADARASSGDEDGVSGEFHGLPPIRG